MNTVPKLIVLNFCKIVALYDGIISFSVLISCEEQEVMLFVLKWSFSLYRVFICQMILTITGPHIIQWHCHCQYNVSIIIHVMLAVAWHRNCLHSLESSK